jgi:transposase InsO family protein
MPAPSRSDAGTASQLIPGVLRTELGAPAIADQRPTRRVRADGRGRRRSRHRHNAVIESFFAILKKKEADRFPSYSDAKMALVDYIEVFYNQRRRHSTLGQSSPTAFERRAAV